MPRQSKLHKLCVLLQSQEQWNGVDVDAIADPKLRQYFITAQTKTRNEIDAIVSEVLSTDKGE